MVSPGLEELVGHNPSFSQGRELDTGGGGIIAPTAEETILGMILSTGGQRRQGAGKGGARSR